MQKKNPFIPSFLPWLSANAHRVGAFITFASTAVKRVWIVAVFICLYRREALVRLGAVFIIFCLDCGKVHYTKSAYGLVAFQHFCIKSGKVHICSFGPFHHLPRPPRSEVCQLAEKVRDKQITRVIPLQLFFKHEEDLNRPFQGDHKY